MNAVPSPVLLTPLQRALAAEGGALLLERQAARLARLGQLCRMLAEGGLPPPQFAHWQRMHAMCEAAGRVLATQR